jgi:septum formation protein
MQVLLSSGSPRRKELLSFLGINFQVKIPNVPEIQLEDESPGDFCSRVSREKALDTVRENSGALVIGADTIVVVDGMILGKPQDIDQARNYLMLLQDKEHEVFTGYTIIYGKRHRTNVVKTRVHFKHMTEEEISWYISTGEPMDKAGAYAVQGIGSLFIDKVLGSYTNVIGLPLSHIYSDLKKFGISLHSPFGGDLNNERLHTGN